jgi:hypothetical protein
LENLVIALLHAEMPFPKTVRLLGVSLSSLQTQGGTTVSNVSSICPSDAANGCGLAQGQDGAESFAWLDVSQRGLSDLEIVDDRS